MLALTNRLFVSMIIRNSFLKEDNDRFIDKYIR
jgi:hypothetical protein